MRAGFPVMTRLFRARAAEVGLDRRDPMEALGDERRRAAARRGDLVAAPVVYAFGHR